MARPRRFLSHEEVVRKELQDPEFRREYLKLKPRLDVSRALTDLREEKGLTQAELAKKARTHQSRVSKIESGELDFRVGTLAQIAEALDAVVSITLERRQEPWSAKAAKYVVMSAGSLSGVASGAGVWPSTHIVGVIEKYLAFSFPEITGQEIPYYPVIVDGKDKTDMLVRAVESEFEAVP